MKKIDYWDLADSERLYYTSVNEAVEEILKKTTRRRKGNTKHLNINRFCKNEA